MESPFCGPRISLNAFPLDGKTHFFFNLFDENLIFRKDWESPLIFVYFFKGKQHKKENPKCDSLFRKDSLRKTKPRFGGQVVYWEDTVKTVASL